MNGILSSSPPVATDRQVHYWNKHLPHTIDSFYALSWSSFSCSPPLLLPSHETYSWAVRLYILSLSSFMRVYIIRYWFYAQLDFRNAIHFSPNVLEQNNNERIKNTTPTRALSQSSTASFNISIRDRKNRRITIIRSYIVSYHSYDY